MEGTAENERILSVKVMLILMTKKTEFRKTEEKEEEKDSSHDFGRYLLLK